MGLGECCRGSYGGWEIDYSWRDSYGVGKMLFLFDLFLVFKLIFKLLNIIDFVKVKNKNIWLFISFCIEINKFIFDFEIDLLRIICFVWVLR